MAAGDLTTSQRRTSLAAVLTSAVASGMTIGMATPLVVLTMAAAGNPVRISKGQQEACSFWITGFSSFVHSLQPGTRICIDPAACPGVASVISYRSNFFLTPQ